MRAHSLVYSLTLSALFFCTLIKPIDNPHFYRAPYFWDEPRFERSALSSAYFNIGFATTHHSRDSQGAINPLWSSIGSQNFQFMGVNVPGITASNPADQILIDVAALGTNGTFGTVAYNGTFSCIELIGTWYQNLVNGFFLQAHLPLVRSLNVSDIHFVDLSPTEGFPNKNTPIWQSLLNNLNPIFNQFEIIVPNSTHATGIGDFSFLAGWAGTYQNTVHLDFVDVSAKVGGLFPTARRRSVDKPFQLPLGYDGFYGLPIKFDCSIGAFEWLTLGFHNGALFLFKQHRTLRLKTTDEQNGFIILAKECAQIDPGTIWELAVYAKADHVVRGFSVLTGYSFTKRDVDTIGELPLNFDPIIVNSDERLNGWTMHTLHAMAEYDWATSIADWGPRIGIWFNIILAGRRVFNAHLYNSQMGIECAWYY